MQRPMQGVCGLSSSEVGTARKWNKVSLEEKSGKCRTHNNNSLVFFQLLSWGIFRLSLQFLCTLVPTEAEWKIFGCNGDWGGKGYLRLKKKFLLIVSYCIKNIFELFWFLIVCLDHTQHPLYVLTSFNSLQMFSPKIACVSSPTVIKVIDFIGLLCICLIIDISLHRMMLI